MAGKELVVGLLKKEGVDGKLVESVLEVPPDSSLGDFGFPCFVLSKEWKKSPQEIASELAGKLKVGKGVREVKAVGPYVNFFLEVDLVSESVLKDVWKKKERYGAGGKKKGKVMVEYSQPNTHKEFHVGHLRNVALGSSLIKIMRFDGKEVIAANYINDTGAHVAKCLWYLMKKGTKPVGNKGEWLGKVYVEATQELEKDDSFKGEVSDVLQRLEAHEKEMDALWKETRQWSLDAFNDVYGWLGVEFDVWFYDHEMIEGAKKFVEKLEKKGIAKESEGAIIVDLENEGLHTLVVGKSDGTIPYISKDFALASIKFEKFMIEENVYVVGSEQELHFRQLFKILELFGFKNAKRCFHLSYDLVMLPEGKMSSRLGNVVLFSDLKNELMDSLKGEVEKRHDWPAKRVDSVAKDIAVGALMFGMLCQDHQKSIVFDLKEWLNFEGETGPYVQYAHARLRSVLRKAKKKVGAGVDFSLLSEGVELELVKLLELFPSKVDEAASSRRPSLIARYCLDVAQKANDFYHRVPVLKAEKKLMEARLLLVWATAQVLCNGLSLLGIVALDEM